MVEYLMQPDPRIIRYGGQWLVPGTLLAGLGLLALGVFGFRDSLAVAGSILIASLVMSKALRQEPPEL